jgi:hypothetical protein
MVWVKVSLQAHGHLYTSRASALHLKVLTLAITTTLRALRFSDDVANCKGKYLLRSSRAHLRGTTRSAMRVMVPDTYIDAGQKRGI